VIYPPVFAGLYRTDEWANRDGARTRNIKTRAKKQQQSSKLVSVSTSRSGRCQYLPVAMMVANDEEELKA
jgi:hypothetical protein